MSRVLCHGLADKLVVNSQQDKVALLGFYEVALHAKTVRSLDSITTIDRFDAKIRRTTERIKGTKTVRFSCVDNCGLRL